MDSSILNFPSSNLDVFDFSFLDYTYDSISSPISMGSSVLKLETYDDGNHYLFPFPAYQSLTPLPTREIPLRIEKVYILTTITQSKNNRLHAFKNYLLGFLSFDEKTIPIAKYYDALSTAPTIEEHKLIFEDRDDLFNLSKRYPIMFYLTENAYEKKLNRLYFSSPTKTSNNGFYLRVFLKNERNNQLDHIGFVIISPIIINEVNPIPSVKTNGFNKLRTINGVGTKDVVQFQFETFKFRFDYNFNQLHPNLVALLVLDRRLSDDFPNFLTRIKWDNDKKIYSGLSKHKTQAVLLQEGELIFKKFIKPRASSALPWPLFYYMLDSACDEKNIRYISTEINPTYPMINRHHHSYTAHSFESYITRYLSVLSTPFTTIYHLIFLKDLLLFWERCKNIDLAGYVTVVMSLKWNSNYDSIGECEYFSTIIKEYLIMKNFILIKEDVKNDTKILLILTNNPRLGFKCITNMREWICELYVKDE